MRMASGGAVTVCESGAWSGAGDAAGGAGLQAAAISAKEPARYSRPKRIMRGILAEFGYGLSKGLVARFQTRGHDQRIQGRIDRGLPNATQCASRPEHNDRES